MGHVYVKFFLGTLVHQGASLRRGLLSSYRKNGGGYNVTTTVLHLFQRAAKYHVAPETVLIKEQFLQMQVAFGEHLAEGREEIAFDVKSVDHENVMRFADSHGDWCGG